MGSHDFSDLSHFSVDVLGELKHRGLYDPEQKSWSDLTPAERREQLLDLYSQLQRIFDVALVEFDSLDDIDAVAEWMIDELEDEGLYHPDVEYWADVPVKEQSERLGKVFGSSLPLDKLGVLYEELEDFLRAGLAGATVACKEPRTRMHDAVVEGREWNVAHHRAVRAAPDDDYDDPHVFDNWPNEEHHGDWEDIWGSPEDHEQDEDDDWEDHEDEWEEIDGDDADWDEDRDEDDVSSDAYDPVGLAMTVLETVVARLPHGEGREGQRQMCEWVVRALADGEDLAVRAGPLTGKTLAYAVAAATYALTRSPGKPIVITCPTLAAQDQATAVLADVHDALLTQGLGQLRYASLKGRNNYLCVERLMNLRTEGRPDEDRQQHLDALLDWSHSTDTGDLQEHLGDIPSDLTDAVSGDGCDHASIPSLPTPMPCYANIALLRAGELHILVTNHFKYVWNLKSDRARLPEHHAVIIEEADFLLDVVSSVCTRRITVSDEISESLLRLAQATGLSQAIIADLRDALAARGQSTADNRAVSVLWRHLQDPDLTLPTGVPLPPNLEALIEEVRDAETPHYLYLRASKSALKLCATPMHPNRWLEQHQPPECPLIMCSSTLTSSSEVQQLSQLSERHAVREPAGAEVYPQQAMLYVPRDMPNPSDESLAFRTEAFAETLALLEAIGGRALILSATTQGRDDTYGLLKVFEERLGFTLLRQGDLPPLQLLQRFQADAATVVCAVKQLWWSIDVPGDGLQLVIIDKIPFANPSRPLVWERDGAAPVSHGDHYAERMLAQAIHRLIRTKNDRGVVALLDSRYWDSLDQGRDLLQLAPPIPTSASREATVEFLRELRRR